MGQPIYFTDIDGTLLDLYGDKGTAGILNKMFPLPYRVSIGPPCHYNFEEAYGITRGSMLQLFDKLWDVPVPPYEGAIEFVQELKSSGFKVLGLSMRPSDDARLAGYRDIPILGLDGIYMVDDVAEKPGIITKLSEGNECFYLDDKIESAIDVSIKCLNCRVQLINRPWNKSLDLCMEYDRVFGYVAAADGARYIHGRRNPDDIRNWGDKRDERGKD